MDEGIIRIFENKKTKPHTEVFGRKLYEFESVDSVMDIAHKKAKDGEEEGVVILAKEQKKGRGRFNRKWLSPYGKGLYFAIILRPDIKHCDAPKITLLSAISIAEVINNQFKANVKIRWPNDILINEKKAAGILTESNTKANKLHYLVVGIGININPDKKLLPKQAASLENELKTKIDANALLFKILKKFEENYFLFLKKDFAYFIPNIEKLSVTLGKRVKIDTQKHTLVGIVQDIDKDGALILRLDNGFVEKILTGDCFHLQD